MYNKEIAKIIVKQWLLDLWLNKIGDSIPDQVQVAHLQIVIEKELNNFWRIEIE